MLKKHAQILKKRAEDKILLVSTESEKLAFVEWLKNAATGLIKIHPREFKELLKELKLEGKINHLQEIAGIMDSEMNSYVIKDQEASLEVQLQDQSSIKESVFDVGSFLEQELKLTPASDMYFLFLGLFSHQPNYEAAQFYELAKKIVD